MEHELNLDSPIFCSFTNELNGQINALLNCMKRKNSTYGSISVKLEFEVTPKMVTDDTTGETKRMDIPKVGYKIKPRISVDLVEGKGEYLNTEYLIEQNEEGQWIYRHTSEQISIFEQL